MSKVTVPTMEEMLEAGVHFGHQTSKWHPQMEKYIFDAREGVHILNLEKTHERLTKAVELVKEIAQKGGRIIFVGTKRQAAPSIQRYAEASKSFYVNSRWPGGLITNFGSIKEALKRYKGVIDQIEDEATFDKLSTKDKFLLRKERIKMDRVFAGLLTLDNPPDLLIIIDPKRENTAVREARGTKTPTIGIVDTNTNPNLVDFPIPANDDALKSIDLILEALSNAASTPKKVTKKTTKPKSSATITK